MPLVRTVFTFGELLVALQCGIGDKRRRMLEKLRGDVGEIKFGRGKAP